MIDRQPRPRSQAMASVALFAAVAFGACGGGADAGNADDTDDDAAAATAATASRSACDVLTGEDVSGILGQTLEARPDPEEQTPRYSSCGYYPGEGYGVLYLTAYWSGGKDEWDSWQMATSYAGQMWEQAEKVDLDSITGASLVSGLGDRAYFGGMMPSLVLKGDVLLEFKLALVTDEKHNFPLLAKAALARLQ